MKDRRYALGLFGDISSAIALLLASKGLDNFGRRALVSGGIGMGLYAVATGAVVTKALFFPAALLNHVSFLKTFGFPIQLARGVFAVRMAFSIWFYSQVSYGQGIEAKYKEFRWRFSLNMSLSVIMADIDHFKRYNDAYGHQSGDRLLAGAAGILMKSVRDSDLVTRYGGGGYYCEILTRRF